MLVRIADVVITMLASKSAPAAWIDELLVGVAEEIADRPSILEAR